MNQKDHIERAVAIAGSQVALAKKMGVSQQAVWKWLHGPNECPLNSDRAIDMEIATDGIVTRHQLRPDKFGEHPEPA